MSKIVVTNKVTLTLANLSFTILVITISVFFLRANKGRENAVRVSANLVRQWADSLLSIMLAVIISFGFYSI